MADDKFSSEKIRSFDGHHIAVHHFGEQHRGKARTLMLIHGLFSNAHTNWIKYGHAAQLAEAGYHVIMPDLRGHGQSDAPHERQGWPADVIVHDMHALIDHYALEEFDLGGFSLGARSVAKLLTQGVSPHKVIMAGMGWEGLSGWDKRRDYFLKVIDERDSVKRGEPHYFAAQFFKTTGMDPVASKLLLHSLGDVDGEALSQVDIPVAVICGDEDQDNGSAQKLADQLANGVHIAITGTHMSSVTKRALGAEMVTFLTT